LNRKRREERLIENLFKFILQVLENLRVYLTIFAEMKKSIQLGSPD